MLRVPYRYYPSGLIKELRAAAISYLGVIHDVHHDIPNERYYFPEVKAYMYYPCFLRWIWKKATSELIRRGVFENYGFKKRVLDDKFLVMRSRSIEYFIPPTEDEIAQDVVWLLHRWRNIRDDAHGDKIPISYAKLAEKHYGYTPKQESNKRIDEFSRRSYHDDAGWYRSEGET